jgi:hypothetical protein
MLKHHGFRSQNRASTCFGEIVIVDREKEKDGPIFQGLQATNARLVTALRSTGGLLPINVRPCGGALASLGTDRFPAALQGLPSTESCAEDTMETGFCGLDPLGTECTNNQCISSWDDVCYSCQTVVSPSNICPTCYRSRTVFQISCGYECLLRFLSPGGGEW